MREPPSLPGPTPRLPTIVLWLVPFALVLLYVLLVDQFFRDEARWTADLLPRILLLLLLVSALFSVLWFATAYATSLLLGEFVPLGILLLLAKIPSLNRHVIVTPPSRPDTTHEVWGRFGVLLLVTLGFELIFIVLLVHQGDLAPNLAVAHPIRIFVDELVAGVLLALVIAPAAPFLASRFQTRITDSLPFPLLWLALLLLVVGGVGILEFEVLPGVVFSPGLFLVSILLYAPAAWFVCLAFSRTEAQVQEAFLRRAWAARSAQFHFGRLRVTDEPEGTVREV